MQCTLTRSQLKATEELRTDPTSPLDIGTLTHALIRYTLPSLNTVYSTPHTTLLLLSLSHSLSCAMLGKEGVRQERLLSSLPTAVSRSGKPWVPPPRPRIASTHVVEVRLGFTRAREWMLSALRILGDYFTSCWSDWLWYHLLIASELARCYLHFTIRWYLQPTVHCW